MANLSSEVLKGYFTQKQEDGSLTKLLPEISGNSIHYIEGNTTGTAGTWIGTSDEISKYYNGLTIAYKIGIAGASTTTLNINDLGAITVYRNATSKITTHYPVNSIIILVYTSGSSGVGSWQTVDYDSTNTYQFRPYYGKRITLDALYRYMIVVSDFDGNLIPLNTANNTKGTTKTMTTREFNPCGFIFYYNSTTTVSANGKVTASSLYYQLTFDARYSLNCGQTLKTDSPLYLVANKSTSSNCVTLSNPAYSQSLPMEDDGKIYIYLGRTYSTYQLELSIHHPIYEFVNGEIRNYQPLLSYNELKDKPTIPTKVSELTNDSGYTTNTGTITGIKMNGVSKGTSGVVDLGTVITAHQDISGKLDKTVAESTYQPKGDYALSSSIPTVNNPTITIKQGGTTKGSFTLNQSNATTIELDSGSGSSITIDSALSSASTNPVQNKAIYTALNGKMNALENGDIYCYTGNTYGSSVTINGPNSSYSMQIGESGFTIDDAPPEDGPNNVLTCNYNTFTYKGYNVLTTNNVDSALSRSSTNPLQNKAIYTALNNKLDKSITNVSSNTSVSLVNYCYLCLPKTTSNVTLTIESTAYTIKVFFLIYATTSTIYLCYHNTSGVLTIVSKSWNASSSYYFSVKCNYSWSYKVLSGSL